MGDAEVQDQRDQPGLPNVVYYESIKRELKIRCIYECRCDERLQTKTKEFTRLTHTGFRAFPLDSAEFFLFFLIFFLLLFCELRLNGCLRCTRRVRCTMPIELKMESEGRRRTGRMRAPGGSFQDLQEVGTSFACLAVDNSCLTQPIFAFFTANLPCCALTTARQRSETIMPRDQNSVRGSDPPGMILEGQHSPDL